MDVSVVCPFYNESPILESAVKQLLDRLESLEATWELIIVDDGSTDGSGEIAKRIAKGQQRLRVLGYPRNRGRGYALRTGIAAARGEVIVTTEIDLSWGEDIVHRLVEAMRGWPDTDIVVASPHLKGGGYRNVPPKRVFFSRLGNWVIRGCMGNAVTMNTGMTRAYRAEAIKSIPLNEDRKEFHLEVILKAVAFGHRIREIPAVLEWRDYKHQDGRLKKRVSSSRVGRLVVSHSLFSLSANPVRYIWAMSFISLALGVVCFVAAVIVFILDLVSAYLALMSVMLVLLALLLFMFGIVVKQGNMVQRELWIVQRATLGGQREEESRPAAGSGKDSDSTVDAEGGSRMVSTGRGFADR